MIELYGSFLKSAGKPVPLVEPVPLSNRSPTYKYIACALPHALENLLAMSRYPKRVSTQALGQPPGTRRCQDPRTWGTATLIAEESA